MEHNSNKVTVVMYHYVRDLLKSRYPDIKGLTTKQFSSQIAFFKNNFNIISTEQLLEAKYANLTLPENPLLLTFDDGYIDHYTNVFPILKNHDVSSFFAVPAKVLAEEKVLDVNKIHFILASQQNTQHIIDEIYAQLDHYRGTEYQFKSNEDIFNELAIANRFDTKEVIFIKRLLQNYLPEELRNAISDHLFNTMVGIDETCFAKELYLSYDQVKLMKNSGMTFGCHGYEHYWFNKLSEDEMKKDINLALDYFDGIIDKSNWIMTYPYGAYNDNVINYIKSIGCTAAFSTEVNVYDFHHDNVHAIPRLDTNDFPPKTDNYLKYK